MKISNAFAAASLASLSRLNSGVLRFYSGAAPATVDDAATGTLLAELTFGATAFAVSNNVATANAITSDSAADATGTAGYARAFQSGGVTAECDFSVGGTAQGSTGDIVLTTSSIATGQPVQISSFTITLPKG